MKKIRGQGARFRYIRVILFWNVWNVADVSEINEANFIRLGEIVDPIDADKS
jgi:hypothetical protein